MEPFDINAGRFYLRALHAESTFDDSEVLQSVIPPSPILSPQDAENGWMENTRYSWTVCEQTSAELLALVTYDPDTAEICTHTAGAPETLWDKNPDLEPVSLEQAAEAGRKAVHSAVISSA